jgi:LysR family transcriptional regulator for metE and metH
VASRSWFVATCKQTPAIQNFLECLKMYFSGADMSIDEAEMKTVIQEHEVRKQPIVSPALVFRKPVGITQAQDFKDYQY